MSSARRRPPRRSRRPDAATRRSRDRRRWRPVGCHARQPIRVVGVVAIQGGFPPLTGGLPPLGLMSPAYARTHPDAWPSVSRCACATGRAAFPRSAASSSGSLRTAQVVTGNQIEIRRRCNAVSTCRRRRCACSASWSRASRCCSSGRRSRASGRLDADDDDVLRGLGFTGGQLRAPRARARSGDRMFAAAATAMITAVLLSRVDAGRRRAPGGAASGIAVNVALPRRRRRGSCSCSFVVLSVIRRVVVVARRGFGPARTGSPRITAGIACRWRVRGRRRSHRREHRRAHGARTRTRAHIGAGAFDDHRRDPRRRGDRRCARILGVACAAARTSLISTAGTGTSRSATRSRPTCGRRRCALAARPETEGVAVGTIARLHEGRHVLRHACDRAR